MTVGQIRVKDLPDTGSIAGSDTVLVDNGSGTRSKTITELAAAVGGGSGFPTPVTETTIARTLTDADNGATIRCTHADGCTITVPDTLTPGFSCSAFPDHATGHVAWAQDGTMVVENANGFLSATVRYAVSGVIVHSATLGIVTGALDS